MPVYPQTPEIAIESVGTIENDGFRELALNIFTHTGTHLDAPAHILHQGKTIDQFPVSHFSGSGIVLKHSSDKPLTKSNLNQVLSKLENIEFVLIHSGYSKYWGNSKYYKNLPLPHPEVFEFLSTLSLKGIGIDAISIDDVGSTSLPNHHSILSKNMVIIENLTNLEPLFGKRFQFNCFPLSIENGDGSPVRATAQLL